MQARRKKIDKTAKGAREAAEKRPPRAQRLSLQERAFVRAYASDPQSPTFGVGVRSAMKAGYGSLDAPLESTDYKSANRAALQLLERPKVKSEIERVFESHQLTVSDRARAVADILHSPTVETLHTTETVDTEGNSKVSSRQIIVSSNHSNVLKAVDTLNRMDGTYTKAADVVHTRSKVLQPLLDHFSRQMRRALSESALQERVAGQGETLEGEVIDIPIGPSEASGEALSDIPPSDDASVRTAASDSVVEGEQVSRQVGDEW